MEIIKDEQDKTPVELCEKLSLGFKKKALKVHRAKDSHFNVSLKII